MPILVPPRSTVEGFVYTKLDGGVKYLSVLLVHPQRPPQFEWVAIDGWLRQPRPMGIIGSNRNGIKLSSNTLPYQCFARLSAWPGSPQASSGQRVTAWVSIHFDQAARRLRGARIPLTVDKKMAFD
jgi:hypothetical protein